MARAKVDLAKLLADCGVITPDDFARLQADTGWSATYLRRRLLASGHPLHPLVQGVRQDNPANLAQSLLDLASCYGETPVRARALVLEAKRHAGFVLRKRPNDAWRLEVLLHLRTWLENPPVYPVWLRLKNRKPPDESPGGHSSI